MSYLKAEECLPEHLVSEIQKYIQGAQIYIPVSGKKRKGWGRRNGSRERLLRRNELIKSLKKGGSTVDDLADEFNLSTDSIKKILYRSGDD